MWIQKQLFALYYDKTVLHNVTKFVEKYMCRSFFNKVVGIFYGFHLLILIPAGITCSKLTMETLEKGKEHAQS